MVFQVNFMAASGMCQCQMWDRALLSGYKNVSNGCPTVVGFFPFSTESQGSISVKALLREIS